MKSLIEYYYNLKIDELFIENNNYHFKVNGSNYFFCYFQRDEKDLKEIYDVVLELKNKSIPTCDIVLNVENKLFTFVEDAKYVLLKADHKNISVDITNIIEYDKILATNSNNYKNSWDLLWEKKIDLIENVLSTKNEFPYVENTIDYYIGLMENAIYYVKNIKNKYNISSGDKVVLSRKRIYFPNTLVNYFNPLNFIFDLEVRDVAEYLKSIFFKDQELAQIELRTFLKSRRLTSYSYNMLFARLLLPSYYFDLYEKIVNNNEKEECLDVIISQKEDFEKFLKKAYKEISLYAPLENITYLIS